jgi:non-homologous end joining protein Ku
LTSEYRQDLRKMLEAKLAGQPIEEPEEVTEAPVIDLMAALKQSVAEAKQRKPAAEDGKPAAKPRSRRTAAKS